MKRGSFAGLVYRDFYLIRKPLLTGLIMFAGFAAFCWLMLLSFNYGNIGRILNDLLVSADGTMTEDAESIMGNLRRTMFIYMKFFPAIMATEFMISTSDLAVKDTLVSWQRYLHCTPVTPLKYASVRVTVNVMCTAAAFVLALTYILLIGLASGEELTYDEFAVFMLAIMVFFLFCAVGQIFILLLNSRDKGMLVSLGVLLIPILIIAWNSRNNPAAEEDGFDSLINIAKVFCPFSPLILVGITALLFAALYFIYKRREK